ncbi:DNA-binding CsgD family transcriptional regulator [Variovorax boronicumulans]|uniref:DNA-binding CsgD family transcriptional regulator n=1 Tax=Variovorax boronicumulans TaxID=436515 RepID=A0AAW8E7M0_9BURK|nr:LuxR C-terminal-related transcriptional regulator [Variovorax boronicumulans]MDP9882256.1 DNA-binding CsgD family transcriptional regulator [Variovorax boronicumulans]MDP9927579.1 DNA-binding CsgD family transcriptional regulator [Variovorax boronicumulans]
MLEDHDILVLQRQLRRRLFEGERAITWRPGRELAAQLLLYLDDPQACWRISVQWLRDTLDADRVDAGFGGYVDASGRLHDYVVAAEVQRPSQPLPAVIGLRFSAANPGIRAVWSGSGIAPIIDVSQERSFTQELRATLMQAGTASKLAVPVHDEDRPVGMICADWHHRAPRWKHAVCDELPDLARTALGPLLSAAHRFAQAQSERAGATDHPANLAALTPAELKVAKLAAGGLSYKEIARQLDRSLSTIDHQLRSIREKLGTRSTARLVHMLSELNTSATGRSAPPQ